VTEDRVPGPVNSSPGPPTPLFPRAVIDRLRACLSDEFSGQAVTETLGLAGQAALSRGDLTGVERFTRGGSATETLIRLFLLGIEVADDAADRVFGTQGRFDAVAAGLLEPGSTGVRTMFDLRPYSEAGGPDWWVISDLGAEVRPGALDPEHVLGVGAAAATLAQATMRRPVETALDIGTGCGVQALHLSRHARSVVATDLSGRALRMAATTAALNGLRWDLRAGSLLDPVRAEQFDLVVSNPPFIVGPGFTASDEGFTYRDSGLPGDEVCRQLISGLAPMLRPGGTAQVLANWMITADGQWEDRLAGWLGDADCDVWIWQREVADPGEYVSLWLRDAGEQPGSRTWRSKYDRWLDWFAENGVLAVGMGLVNLRRSGSSVPVIVAEDVPQAVEQPIGAEIATWFARQDWLRSAGPAGLLDASFTVVADLIYEQRALLGPTGWQSAVSQLRQARGMRWELETDSAVAGLLSSCTGQVPLRASLALVAELQGLDPAAVTSSLLPVVADLVQRGILLPPETAAT
jgi:methylase of polypeptide subunit release factors